MLLDANNSEQNAAPRPDRGTLAGVQPARRDDPPPADDRRAGAASNSADASDISQNTSSDHENSAADVNEAAKCQGSNQDGNQGGNDEDSPDTTTAGDGNTDQTVAVSVDACAQLTPALMVEGPAIAPAVVMTDAAPTQSATNDIAVAPIVSGATSGASETAFLIPAKAVPNAEPNSASQPAEQVQGNEPAEPPKLANTETPAIGTAAEPTDADDFTKLAPPAEPRGNATPATPATPAEPAKKSVLADQTMPGDGSDPIEPVKAATPAAPAAPATPASPALAKQTTKAASTDATAAAKNDHPQAQAVSLDDTNAPQADSANTNPNPAAAAHNPTKDANTGTEGELSAANAHRLAPEPKTESKAEPNTEIVNRILDSASLNGRAENVQSLAPAMPAPQAASAASQSNPAPVLAAAAAVPLSALPVEIAARAKDGKNRFEIRLDPPELGRIDVRLDIDRNGHVMSRLMVERPETLDLLRRDAQQIERALQDAGLKTSEQGLQFSLRDQSFAEQNDDTLPTASIILPQDDIVPLAAIRQGYGQLLGLGGGIDIRV